LLRDGRREATKVSDYKVGYGRPPKATQFKKGISANPKGRPKRKPGVVGDVIKDVLNAPVEYREGGQTKKAPRRELALKRHLKRAVEGDVSSAAAVLKLRAQAVGRQSVTREVVHFTDLLPIDAEPVSKGKVEELPTHDGAPVSAGASDLGLIDDGDK
jgi:hypothetical protein